MSNLAKRGSIHLTERVATTAALSVYFVIGFFSVQFIPAVAPIRVPMTGLDQTISFAPDWAWVYVWAIPAAFAPAFLVRSPPLFRSAAAAYFWAITLSLAVFVVFPASAVALRPSSTDLDLTDPSQWLVANFYAIDPPGNLFPSLHLSMTTLSAWAVWKADHRLGRAAFLGVVLVAVSTCAVKQHFIADVVGGVSLAALVGYLTIYRCRAEMDDARAPSAAPLLLFVLFVILIYASIVCAYYSGLRMPNRGLS